MLYFQPHAPPYTREGLQLDVLEGTEWVEIGECGLTSPEVLTGAHGLAMGLGPIDC